MRRRFSDRPGLHTLSELNVTPMLDLAFVLLIIFMITTPLMESSTDLVLPASDAGASSVDPDKVHAVSIHADGGISFNGEPASIEGLSAQIESLRAAEPDLAILIRSHHEQSVQRFSEVLDIVRRAGIKRIGFASVPKD